MVQQICHLGLVVQGLSFGLGVIIIFIVGWVVVTTQTLDQNYYLCGFYYFLHMIDIKNLQVVNDSKTIIDWDRGLRKLQVPFLFGWM